MICRLRVSPVRRLFRRAAQPGLFLGALLALSSACYRPPDAVALWTEHCANCHWTDGTGHPSRIRTQANLDLTRSPLVERQLDGRIYRYIRSGGPAMPGFSHKLEHEEIQALTRFVLDLKPESPSDPTVKENAP